MAERMLDVEQAANILGVCAKTIRRMIARKEIQAIRIGAALGRPTYRIPRAWLEDFKRSREDDLEARLSRR